MTVSMLVAIAADVGLDGERRLLTGDRAAVAWGVAFAGSICRVVCLDHDLEAAAYVRALGATVASWNDLRSVFSETTIIGPAAIELAGDEFAGRLAEDSGAELLFDVLAAECAQGAWKITCDAGRGARDIIRVSGPVVMVVSPDVARPRYVSAYRRSNARRACDPAAIKVEPRIPVTSPWQPMTPRTPRSSRAVPADAKARADQAFNVQPGSATPAQVVITEPPPIAAGLLLRFLIHRGFVARSLDLLPPLEASRTTPETAVKTHSLPLAAPGDEVQLAAAIRRGPRHRVDTEARLARRPRHRSTFAGGLPQRANMRSLKRGPRRLAPASPVGLRGPFRIDSGAIMN